MESENELSVGIPTLPSHLDTETRSVYLFGDIEEDMVEEALKSFRTLEAGPNGKKPITIYVNTFGGCLTSSLAIFDIIRSSPCLVETVAIGSCMSGGIVIFSAGDTRRSMPNCAFMTHDVVTGAHPSNPESVAHDAARARTLFNNYISAIARQTKQKKSFWADKMPNAKSNWFGAKEALAWGLATYI